MPKDKGYAFFTEVDGKMTPEEKKKRDKAYSDFVSGKTRKRVKAEMKKIKKKRKKKKPSYTLE